MRLYKTRLVRVVCVGAAAFVLVLVYVLGVVDYISEDNFNSNFDYPLNVNIRPLVEQIRFGIEPDFDPINYYKHTFSDNLEAKCGDDINPHLVIVVKSAMEHFDRRAVIRKTWGLERRFEDLVIKTIFVLGIRKDYDGKLQEKINAEHRKHADVVQSDFVDSYYNNTIKTMMGFRWASDFCPSSNFYLFSDDDMFISIKNLLKFLQDPHNYPEPKQISTLKINEHNHLNDKDTKDEFLAGFVFKSSPLRQKTSKWYVPLKEYSWNMWPPYVTAGAYVMSNEALKNMYAASLFVKHFRFDDIYLGIVALKLGIKPYHCNEFYFYKKSYSPRSYKYLIASHGYSDPEELENIWMTQLTGGRV